MSLSDKSTDEFWPIVYSDFIPQCCDNPTVELVVMDNELVNMCTNCGSLRPELD